MGTARTREKLFMLGTLQGHKLKKTILPSQPTIFLPRKNQKALQQRTKQLNVRAELLILSTMK